MADMQCLRSEISILQHVPGCQNVETRPGTPPEKQDARSLYCRAEIRAQAAPKTGPHQPRFLIELHTS